VSFLSRRYRALSSLACGISSQTASNVSGNGVGYQRGLDRGSARSMLLSTAHNRRWHLRRPGDWSPPPQLALPQEADMDSNRFDRLAITVSQRTTRRAALGLLAALGVMRPGRATAVSPACQANGRRCGGARGPCCSGVCKRKRGTHKSFCRAAPHQSLCTIASDVCALESLTCSKTGDTCRCYISSAGRSFCGQNACADQTCTLDEHCGPNAICIPAGTSCCGGNNGCVVACLDPV
jgi:hypothetical protein